MRLCFVYDVCVDVANDGVHYLPPTATRTRRTKKKRIANDACIVVLHKSEGICCLTSLLYHGTFPLSNLFCYFAVKICPMLSKVLTRFYLPMGATLTHGVLNAVFGALKSLDTFKLKYPVMLSFIGTVLAIRVYAIPECVFQLC